MAFISTTFDLSLSTTDITFANDVSFANDASFANDWTFTSLILIPEALIFSFGGAYN